MIRHRRLLAGAVALGAIATVAGVVVAPRTPRAAAASAAAGHVPVDTAAVQKQTLSAIVSQPGTLTYQARPDGSPYSVINRGRGSYTELPQAGDVIAEGQVLYRIDDRPVVLLRGSTPAYRDLQAGVIGPSVVELNADLVTLGYASRAELDPKSASFGAATTAAVEKLQARLGVTRSGKLELGDVVFEPASVRVTNVSVQPGGIARPGETVLQGTSTVRLVQVALDASQQTSVSVGDTVSITLPNNQTTPGVVSRVGAVATCPPSSGSGGQGSSSAAPGTDSCAGSDPGSGSTPTIAVDVTPSHPAITGRWDQAPVQVGITTARVPNAVVVPVTALLAQADGGYAVEVVGARTANRLVPVSLGLFDDAQGTVQVISAGLVPGQEVVVAST